MNNLINTIKDLQKHLESKTLTPKQKEQTTKQLKNLKIHLMLAD